MEGLVLKIFIVSILQCLQSNVGEFFKLLILYWPGYLKQVFPSGIFHGCQTWFST